MTSRWMGRHWSDLDYTTNNIIEMEAAMSILGYESRSNSVAAAASASAGVAVGTGVSVATTTSTSELLMALADSNVRGEAAHHALGDAVVMPFGIAYCYEYGNHGQRALFCAIPTEFDDWIAPGSDYNPSVHGLPHGASSPKDIANLMLSL